MSNWPDHTPEPGETPSWLGYGVVAAAIGAILLWAPGNADWRPSFQLPDFRMPELNLPAIDFTPPDFNTSDQSSSPPQAAAVSEILGETDGPVTQRQVPFDACVSMVADAGNALGQQPFFSVESTDDRQIGVFKFAEGDLTITCSRADGTMTMEQRGSP